MVGIQPEHRKLIASMAAIPYSYVTVNSWSSSMPLAKYNYSVPKAGLLVGVIAIIGQKDRYKIAYYSLEMLC